MEPALEDLTTREIVDRLQGAFSGYSVAQLVGELNERYVEDDDTDEPIELRGGIRPTHPPIH